LKIAFNSWKLLQYLLLLLCLLGRLCGRAGLGLRGGGLDDTDSNGLPHVTHSEPSQGSELAERLHAHWLRRNELDNGSVTRLDELRVILGRLASTTINLLLDLSELTSDVSGVAIKHGTVSVGDLSGVVEDNNLGGEVGNSASRLVLGIGSDISSLDVLDRHVLDVEANVVSGNSLGERLVVHLHDLTSVVSWLGAKVTRIPGLMIPVSTRPTGTVPIPPIL